jgi:hypothetical protein
VVDEISRRRRITIPEGPIEREVLRAAILESLRRKPPGQFETLKSNTAEVLAARGLPVAADTRQGHPPRLRRLDERRFRELLWELNNQGVLVQGMDEANPQWPFLGTTEWGERYLQGKDADPYASNEYLSQVAATNPLDDVEKRFLRQAIGAFSADLPDATAVMLGVTAERLLLLLADGILSASPTTPRGIQRARDWSALRLLVEVRKFLEPRRSKFTRRLDEDFDTVFTGIASLIRVSRNDAGHPTLGLVDRDQAFVVLRLLPY